MTIPYEEVSSILEEMKQIEDDKKSLEDRKKQTEKKFLATLSGHLNAVSRNWRPEIGERVVIADFQSWPPFLFEVMVKVVSGNHCKMVETLMDTGSFGSYLIHTFDGDINDYEVPILTLPMEEYLKLKEKVGLPDFKPLS